MSTLNSSLSRSKYVVWLWLFGISSFRINGVFVLLRFATTLPLWWINVFIMSSSVWCHIANRPTAISNTLTAVASEVTINTNKESTCIFIQHTAALSLQRLTCMHDQHYASLSSGQFWGYPHKALVHAAALLVSIFLGYVFIQTWNMYITMQLLLFCTLAEI